MKFLKNLLAAFIGSLIAFGFLMLLTFGIIGGLVGGLMSSSEPVTVYPNSVLKIDLSSAIGEQTVSEPLDFSTIVPYSGSTSSLGARSPGTFQSLGQARHRLRAEFLPRRILSGIRGGQDLFR